MRFLCAPASIREVINELEQCREQLAAPASIGGQLRVLGRLLRRPAIAIPAVLILAAAALFGYRSLERSRHADWARSEAIPEITRLAAEDNYLDAYALVVKAQQYIPDDPILEDLLEGISFTSAATTDPAGAEVSYRVNRLQPRALGLAQTRPRGRRRSKTGLEQLPPDGPWAYDLCTSTR